MAGSIRIATWNANGLKQHVSEVEYFLHDQKINIFLISETHFTDQSCVRIRGYKMYDCTHPSNKARGGASVVIRENIKHFEEPKFCKEYIQAATVRIQTKKLQCAVSAVYSPPRHHVSKTDYVDFLQSIGTFVIGGDFNVKHTHWCSRLTTPKGRSIPTHQFGFKRKQLNLVRTIPPL